MALGRNGSDEGAEGLKDGIGHAGTDRVPFNQAFNVVATERSVDHTRRRKLAMTEDLHNDDAQR